MACFISQRQNSFLRLKIKTRSKLFQPSWMAEWYSKTYNGHFKIFRSFVCYGNVSFCCKTLIYKPEEKRMEWKSGALCQLLSKLRIILSRKVRSVFVDIKAFPYIDSSTLGTSFPFATMLIQDITVRSDHEVLLWILHEPYWLAVKRDAYGSCLLMIFGMLKFSSIKDDRLVKGTICRSSCIMTAR